MLIDLSSDPHKFIVQNNVFFSHDHTDNQNIKNLADGDKKLKVEEENKATKQNLKVNQSFFIIKKDKVPKKKSSKVIK